MYGYIPHYYFLYAQCLMRSDPPNPAKALEVIRKARDVGAASGNPWVEQYANHLEPHIWSAIAGKAGDAQEG